MALTRKMLRDLGIEDEAIETIIKGNSDSLAGLRDERDELQKKVTELESQKDGIDWESRYNEEHKAFEDYKAETARSAAEAEKAALYRKLLEKSGVDPKRIDKVMKVTDLKDVTVKDGKLEKESELAKAIESEWAEFIAAPETRGVSVHTPPSTGNKSMTRDDILNIKDTQERQRAISENIDLFIGGK